MMDVAQATQAVEAERGDALAVVTMSPLAFWQDARPDDFRLMGTMGAAGSLGLGLALGRPDRRVWVLDGDGSLLMALGVTSAIAGAAPANLTHIVVDNGVYAISGAQPMPTGVDWAALALAAGYRSARACASVEELRAALREPGGGPRMIVARCARERPAYPPGVFQGLDPGAEAARVRAALA
jgi:phosphonopyruvate decarboxylase